MKNYFGLINLKSISFDIHCSSLIFDTKTIATHIGIYDKNGFYYLMPAHKGGTWKKYSTGRLHLIELLKWSIKNNKSIFDFTVGAENYKNIWCNINEYLLECLYPLSIKGKVYYYSYLLKKQLKKTPLINSLRKLRRLFPSFS